jgi:anti-sigma regulatory factor (Ser/Thr protein kinase)
MAAAMTAGTAIRPNLTVPGRPGQVHAARVFTGTTLGDDHPCAAVAVLLVSELVTNSVLHSDSRLPGGTVTVTVSGTPDGVRVEVRDAGGMSAPLFKGADDALAEGGRGLRLVNDLAVRWNYRRDGDGIVTWFEVRAEPPS